MTGISGREWAFPAAIGLFVGTLALQLAAQPQRPAQGDDPTIVSGQLLDLDGKPAAGVWVCLFARWLDIYDSKLPTDFDAGFMRNLPPGDAQRWYTTTDSTGHFSFPAPDGKYILVASTKSGYIVALSTTLKRPITLKIAAWSKVDGQATAWGKPVPAGTQIKLFPVDGQADDEVGPYFHFNVVTDEAGRFHVDRVPAGEFKLFYLLPASKGTVASKPVPATVPPGKTVGVTLAEVVRTVVGRFQMPEGLEKPDDLKLDVNGPVAPVEFPILVLPKDILQKKLVERQAWLATWEKSPEGQRSMAALARPSEERSAEAKTDGSFTMLNAPEGTFKIVVHFFGKEPGAAGSIDYDHRLALRSYRLKIPGGPVTQDTAVVDVGTLAAESYGTAEAGQIAPDFIYQTIGGSEGTLSQLRGKVVLLYFWQSRSGQLMVDLPKVNDIFATFGPNEEFAMLGLNSGDDPARVQQFAQQEGMNWPQVALGKGGSTSWPVRLYRFGGYPTFCLIDRGGKVLTYGHWADDLKDAVGKVLEVKKVQP